MKLLIVAPKLVGVDQAELPEVASGNEPIILHGTVTVAHLQDKLRSIQFDGCHFMQHGNHGVLEMSDGTISQERLALALSNQKNLRFVFLNACNSAGVASTIHNATGTSVIFHEVPINDALAVRLASEFYNGIGSGVTLQKALDDANATVAREARQKQCSFVEAHLINGNAGMQLAERLDRLFNLVSTQLTDIDSRLASVEDEVKQIYRPQYMTWLLVLLVALIIAQIGTALVDVLMRY